MKTSMIILSALAGISIPMATFGGGEKGGEGVTSATVNCMGEPSYIYEIDSPDSEDGHTTSGKHLELFIKGDHWCLRNKPGEGPNLKAKGKIINFGNNGANLFLYSNKAVSEGLKHELYMFSKDWKDLHLNFIAIPPKSTSDDAPMTAHNGQSHGTGI